MGTSRALFAGTGEEEGRVGGREDTNKPQGAASIHAGRSLQLSFLQLALLIYPCSLLSLFIGLFFRKKRVVP